MRRPRPGRLEAVQPPKGLAWIWITEELLSSKSWKTMSINARRVLDFLMIEQLKHAGRTNGELVAPHRQLHAYGIGPQYIKRSIDELEDRGLIVVKRGGKKGSVMSETSTFRLTWLASWEKEGKYSIPVPPTNDWKRYDVLNEEELN